jgi:hypothetical protein
MKNGIITSRLRGELKVAIRYSNLSMFHGEPGYHVHVTDDTGIKHGYDYRTASVEEAIERAVEDFDNCDCAICEDRMRDEMEQACQPAAPAKVLIDGRNYNLGASDGIYDAEHKSFDLGNCFVPKGKTRYADWDDAPVATQPRTQHTPGPWQTGEPYLKIMSDPKPWFVRQVTPKQPTDDIQIALVHANESEERDAELEANARLIAKAPEMLAMLERIVGACEAAGQYTSVHGELIELLKEMGSPIFD